MHDVMNETSEHSVKLAFFVVLVTTTPAFD